MCHLYGSKQILLKNDNLLSFYFNNLLFLFKCNSTLCLVFIKKGNQYEHRYER